MYAYDYEPPRDGEAKAVWIVDDDRSIRWVLEKALAREGIPFKTFATAYEVLQALAVSEPQVLVSDIRMPGESGLALLSKIKERHPQIPVIIMTAYSDLDSAVAAFQGGAFEYLPKPFDVDHAIALIRRATTETDITPSSQDAVNETPEILGQAPAMQEVFRAIGRLSQSNTTVMITGESGTGKELVARALHRHSPRAAMPFVAINTAAIPKDLSNRAFRPDAARTARRRCVADDSAGRSGTLFWTKSATCPVAGALLQVLADGEYYVSAVVRRCARRIIAYASKPRGTRAAGLFREDLMHRLNVVRLRRRRCAKSRTTSRRLARHFLLKVGAISPWSRKRFRRPLKVLMQFAFPGNVRQL
jgi:two-component system nitrogen regulation response regulator GlnG